MIDTASAASAITVSLVHSALYAALIAGLHAVWGRRGLLAGIAVAAFGALLIAPVVEGPVDAVGALRAALPLLIGLAGAMSIIAWRRGPAPRLAPAAADAMRRNLIILGLGVVPLIAVIGRVAAYVSRVALDRSTYHLAIQNSAQLTALFAEAYRAVGLPLMVGGLAYEWLLALEPTRAKRFDAGTLLLLPVIAIPCMIARQARAVMPVDVVPLVLGLLVYAILLRRAPRPASAGEVEERRATGRRWARGRTVRYAACGAALGAALAAYVFVGTVPADGAEAEWTATLALAAEQLFPLTLPLGIPLHAVLIGHYALWTASFYNVLAFVLLAPTANGALVGWLLGRLLDVAIGLRARRTHLGGERGA